MDFFTAWACSMNGLGLRGDWADPAQLGSMSSLQLEVQTAPDPPQRLLGVS